MSNQDGSKATYDEWMDWIDNLAAADFEERHPEEAKRIREEVMQSARKGYKDGN